MGTEDVKVTAMNMYEYKERLRLYKRWPLEVDYKSREGVRSRNEIEDNEAMSCSKLT